MSECCGSPAFCDRDCPQARGYAESADLWDSFSPDERRIPLDLGPLEPFDVAPFAWGRTNQAIIDATEE